LTVVLRENRLPEAFQIYTYCEHCNAWIEADCTCRGDVWKSCVLRPVERVVQAKAALAFVKARARDAEGDE